MKSHEVQQQRVLTSQQEVTQTLDSLLFIFIPGTGRFNLPLMNHLCITTQLSASQKGSFNTCDINQSILQIPSELQRECAS